MTTTPPRVGALDAAVALAACALGALLMVENINDAQYDPSVLAIPVFLAFTVPVLWRRSAPLAALVASLAGLGLHVAIFGSLVRCGAVFPVTFLLIFAAGARLDRRQALIGLAVGLGIVVLLALSDGIVGLRDLSLFIPITAGVWGIGRLARARAGTVDTLRQRTAELREARDERAQLEVGLDRARLSADLDALLHRRLGLLAELADAGARGEDGGDARVALAEIEERSRATLDEMRAMVGVLRADGETVPQPTLTHLEALVLRTKGAGAQLHVEGNPRALPAGVELAAYRIVEHLLDTVEDDAGVDVRVSFGDDALELAVAGRPARRAGAAGAIQRAHERVAVHSGTLTSGMHAGRAEVVAQLPVLAAV